MRKRKERDMVFCSFLFTVKKFWNLNHHSAKSNQAGPSPPQVKRFPIGGGTFFPSFRGNKVTRAIIFWGVREGGKDLSGFNI